MKTICIAIVCVFYNLFSYAQITPDNVGIENIKPLYLTISDSKTTNILFPYAVTRVHCSSAQLKVEQMKDVKNILLVQAAAPGITPTNLSVVTSDGKFYSFELQYAAEPSALNIRLYAGSIERNIVAHVDHNDYILHEAAKLVSEQKRFLKLIDREQLIKLQLDGIYMYQGLMWLKYTVTNFSMIDYPVDYLKVFIKDRLRSKKKIVQEREVTPVFTLGTNHVGAGASATIIMAFDPFTIPVSKILSIQMVERNGGRNLGLNAVNNPFYKTRAIIN
jgi:conjugative transposon TraN protein